MSDTELVESRRRATRRGRALGERRFLRARRTTCSAIGPPIGASTQVHRSRKMDGRLGVAPPPRRPGHDWCIVRLGAAGRDSTASSSTPRSSAGTSPSSARSTRRPRAKARSSRACSRVHEWFEILPAQHARAATRRTPSRCKRADRVHARAPPTFSPTAASRACASTASRCRIGLGTSGASSASRSRGARERRRSRLVQRHVLRPAAQPDSCPAARANMSDGWETKRRAASRAHARLGHREARRAGDARSPRDRHGILQRQLPGHRARRRMRRRPERAVARRCSRAPSSMPPHAPLFFERAPRTRRRDTHLRFKVFPDGGVSRLRAFGTLTGRARETPAARHLACSSPRDLATSFARAAHRSGSSRRS